jgi:hypothetical protein
MKLSSGGLPVLGILRLWFLVLELLGQGFFWVISEEQVCVVCWHFLLFGLLLRAAVSRWRLQFCAQQELVVLCFVFCLFWHCTLVYFGLFSSLNLMMCSSPARLRKKKLTSPLSRQTNHVIPGSVPNL